MSAILHIANEVEESLLAALPSQRKTQRYKLALLVATSLELRTANTMKLAAGLPIETERVDMRYQWIHRFLENELVDCNEIMLPFVAQAIEQSSDIEFVFSIDQTPIEDRFGIVMLSLRTGNRAMPVCWLGKEGLGNIPFEEYKKLLDQLYSILPKKAKIVLLGDRFYGTWRLIEYCQQKGWSYRFRLKKDLKAKIKQEAEATYTGELASRMKIGDPGLYFTGIVLSELVMTNIGIIHDSEEHEEPWIIAMNEPPTYARTLDYGMRWSTESMFSDFKSRGFNLEESQLRYVEKLEKLILIFSLAMHWAIKIGKEIQDEERVKKKAV